MTRPDRPLPPLPLSLWRALRELRAWQPPPELERRILERLREERSGPERPLHLVLVVLGIALGALSPAAAFARAADVVESEEIVESEDDATARGESSGEASSGAPRRADHAAPSLRHPAGETANDLDGSPGRADRAEAWM